jgi:hypothetical protein
MFSGRSVFGACCYLHNSGYMKAIFVLPPCELQLSNKVINVSDIFHYKPTPAFLNLLDPVL